METGSPNYLSTENGQMHMTGDMGGTPATNAGQPLIGGGKGPFR